MPLISTIGRRHWKTRCLIGVLYALLAAGAVTMVYPFGLMLAGATKTAVETGERRLVPAFLTDDAALYRKHVEGLFNESLSQMKWAYDSPVPLFRELEPPAAVNDKLVDAWAAFLGAADLPPACHAAGYMACPQSRGAVPSGLRQFRRELEAAYGGDIGRLNRELGTVFVGWHAVFVLPGNGLERRAQAEAAAFDRVVAGFEARQPADLRYLFGVEGYFKSAYLKARYGRDIAGYNVAHGTAFRSWDEVHLDRRSPADLGRGELEGMDWELFVRGIVALDWVRLDAAAAADYRAFLGARYGSVAALNGRQGTAYARLEDVPLPERAPEAGLGRSDWEAFLQGWKDPVTGVTHRAALSALRLDTVEFRFRDWLKERYGTPAGCAEALGLPVPAGAAAAGDAGWLGILPPQQGYHYRGFLARKDALRREFLARNFRSVWEVMARHGRAVANTAIYCGLAVLCALLFNPLAAYALSRYRPPSTYRWLLFLMLTMAFPPMVTQIPVFLMMRELKLLNTFAALILPTLANGYTIFLLKGFFDSLPRELYECAQLDGAGEWRIFWQLTMRLSTPILAVTALGAFTHAYTNFMMALLLCQDERMWTVMPWLYQLQATSGEGVMFASLVLASIPTLVVFMLCQKVIMRGIVVPVEK